MAWRRATAQTETDSESISHNVFEARPFDATQRNIKPCTLPVSAAASAYIKAHAATAVAAAAALNWPAAAHCMMLSLFPRLTT
jgi:hypothetical protein